MLTRNAAVRDISWAGLKNIFSSFTNGSYVPLTILSYAVENHFVRLNSFHFHLTNVLIHMANVVLTFLLLRLLTKETALSFLTALFFAVNPLNVEAVAWVSARKDLLSSFFFLGSLMQYCLFVESRRLSKGHWLASLGLFACSVLAKPQAMSLPLVLMAIDHYYEQDSCPKYFRAKTPFFIVSLICILIGQISLSPYLTEQTYAHTFTALEKIDLTAFSVIFYILQTLFPLHTSCLYPYPEKVNGWFPWIVYVAAPLLIALTAFAVRKFRSQNVATFALSFFMITLTLPLLNIWLDGYFVSDRYMYLPCIGLFLGILSTVQPIILNRYRAFLRWTILITLIYASFLALLTLGKCLIWRNDIMLWTNVIEQFPKTALAYNNRGAFYMEVNESRQALADINSALQINPEYKDALFNRAIIYTDTGQFDLAVDDYTAIIGLDNRHVESYNNRGYIYFQEKKLTEAINDFSQALTIDPNYHQARYNRAQCHLLMNNPADALLDIDAILRSDPNNSNALNLKKNIKENPS